MDYFFILCATCSICNVGRNKVNYFPIFDETRKKIVISCLLSEFFAAKAATILLLANRLCFTLIEERVLTRPSVRRPSEEEPMMIFFFLF